MKFKLHCKNCLAHISSEGKKSYLLNKKYVIVYTSSISHNTFVGRKKFQSAACNCFLQKIQCSVCYQKSGFFVENACLLCLSRENNGHRNIFSIDSVAIQK